MEEYITDVFTYLGCDVQQNGAVLDVRLTPELAESFRKPKLRLVFQTEHVGRDTELVTHGSYVTGRLYDLLKERGQYMSVILPKTEQPVPDIHLRGSNCVCVTERVREVRKTEVSIIFRVTYYSDEKREEIVTAGIDLEGRVSLSSGFPYTANLLQQAAPHRHPFSQKATKALYEQCVAEVQKHAEQQAAQYQETPARHFHDNITRLEAYYQQMIEELPELDQYRDVHMKQLQDEYDIKVADEHHKCQMQISITPVSFCATSIPVRRTRATFAKANGQKRTAKNPGTDVVIEAFQNLFSGQTLLPHCDSCGRDMARVGICESGSHAACDACLVECHECGSAVCKECGAAVCVECGKWVCPTCSQVCHVCGERYCSRHLLGCLICREHYCRQCATVCESCGKPTAHNHVTVCDISGQRNCPACAIECSCCRKQVSQSLMKACAYCGQQACSECTFQCEVCGDEFCVHHISECDVTGAMVCPKHLGTCKQCGKQVSTAVLHACDICGTKVCTGCSQQCRQCGTFFCEKHSDEIIACTECGTRYCVLCYSGQGPCEECMEDDA